MSLSKSDMPHRYVVWPQPWLTCEVGAISVDNEVEESTYDCNNIADPRVVSGCDGSCGDGTCYSQGSQQEYSNQRDFLDSREL